MTGLEKRLARSNARYAVSPRLVLLKASPKSGDLGRGNLRAGDFEAVRLGRGRLAWIAAPTRSAAGSERMLRSSRRVVRRSSPRAAPSHSEPHEPVRAVEDPPHTALSVWMHLLKAHTLILWGVRRDFGDVPTLPQFETLAQLSRAPQALTMADLSRRLLVSAGNLTGIVGRLERDGLVRREEDPRDGRAFRVRLTQRGRSRIQSLIPRHARLLENLLDGLTSHELEELRELLGRLGDRLEVKKHRQHLVSRSRS